MKTWRVWNLVRRGVGCGPGGYGICPEQVCSALEQGNRIVMQGSSGLEEGSGKLEQGGAAS